MRLRAAGRSRRRGASAARALGAPCSGTPPISASESGSAVRERGKSADEAWRKMTGLPLILRRRQLRAFFENLRVRRAGEPLVLGPRPDMALYAEPVGIVERAAGERAQARIELQGPAHRAAAVGAELHLQPAPALVRTELVGLELAAQLDIVLVEIRADAERAAGAALAIAAVADGPARRLVQCAVTHRAAQTAAFVDLGHDTSLSAAPGDAEHVVARTLVSQHVAVAADAQPLQLLLQHLVEFWAAVPAPFAQQRRLDLEAERILARYGVALLRQAPGPAASRAHQQQSQGEALHCRSVSSRTASLGVSERMRSIVARTCASTAARLVR